MPPDARFEPNGSAPAPANLLGLNRWIAAIFGLAPQFSSGTALTAIYAGMLIVLLCLGQSFLDLHRYAGVDLQVRIVAAERLLNHQDPYFVVPDYQRRIADGALRREDFLLNNNPPTVLAVYGSLDRLPYERQRLIWWGIDWVLLVLSTFVLSRLLHAEFRLAFWLVIFFAVVPTHGWLLHVNRGQCYVETLFFLSLAVALWFDGRETLSGIAIGVAVAWRLTAIGAVIPLLAAKRWRAGIAALATALVTITATLPLNGINAWRSFAALVHVIDRDSLSPNLILQPSPPMETRPSARSGVPPMPGSASITLNDFLPAIDRLLHLSISPNQTWVSKVAALLVLILAGLAARTSMAGDKRWLIFLALLTSLVLDYLVPRRFGYADIVLVVLLPLFLPMFFNGTWLGSAVFAIFLAALAIGDGLPEIGRVELIVNATWIAAALLALLTYHRPKSNDTPAEPI